MDINDVADYIIQRVVTAGVPLNNLKLQKLLYYTNAWHLAFFKRPLFAGGFQAWVHGPVNRTIYNRFVGDKYLYSDIGLDDVKNASVMETIPEDAALHINNILETYAQYSGSQLEDMTHREDPWIQARTGYRPAERCEELIDNAVIERYYSARLQQ